MYVINKTSMSMKRSNLNGFDFRYLYQLVDVHVVVKEGDHILSLHD
jgi:hypothetical protein